MGTEPRAVGRTGRKETRGCAAGGQGHGSRLARSQRRARFMVFLNVSQQRFQPGWCCLSAKAQVRYPLQVFSRPSFPQFSRKSRNLQHIWPHPSVEIPRCLFPCPAQPSCTRTLIFHAAWNIWFLSLRTLLPPLYTSGNSQHCSLSLLH